MNAEMKVSGVGHVKTMLRNIARRVPEAARGQMKRAAERTVERARLYVPEDTEQLKNSIRIEKTYGVRGRLQIDIIAGNKTITTASGRTINLDQYARLVHEAYETAVAKNGPGKRTRAKMAANPSVKIGSGFLFRAIEKEREALQSVMVSTVNKVIAEEGGA